MKNLGKSLVVFEIILSIVIANLLLIVGSLLSLFLLFPVMLVSTLYIVRRMYLYREFNGIIYNFIYYMKGNILATIKLIYPLIIFVILLVFSITYYNQIVFEMIDPFFVWLIYIIQAFMLYQAVGVMLISAILYTKNNTESPTAILNKAFIIFNAHPIKGVLSMISLVMGTVFVIYVIPYAYMLFLPISLFMFYVVFSDVIETKKFAE